MNGHPFVFCIIRKTVYAITIKKPPEKAAFFDCVVIACTLCIVDITPRLS